MTPKHTPGPWEHRGLTMISGRNVDGCMFTLANVTPAGDLHNAAECAANARLIAAAPELLAALRALLPDVDHEIEQRKHGGNDEDWQELDALSRAAHAAIAKAEGV